MFGRRSDGKKVKDLQIIDKAISYFMPMRIDAVQYTTIPFNCAGMDKFILEEKKRIGVHYSYTKSKQVCQWLCHLSKKLYFSVNECA